MNVILETEFQNKNLNLPRSSSTNRDILPRLCFNHFKANLEIKFIDTSKTSISSLFYNNTYTVQIYSFDFDCKTNYNSTRINLNKLVYSNNNLKLNSLIRLNTLKLDELYLLELKINVNTKMCGRKLCPDESNQNNQIRCKDCNKLIVHFKSSNHIKSECFKETAYIVPSNFDIKNMNLNLDTIQCNLHVKTYVFGYLFCFSLVCFLILLSWRKFKSRYQVKNQKLLITFYLSVFVDSNYQMNLKQITTDYLNIFMSIFTSFDFDIIDYKTSLNERKYLLNNSYMIIYVCGSSDELNLNGKQIRIGRSIYYDEFNKLNFLKKFKSKLVNIIFDDENSSDIKGLMCMPKQNKVLTRMILEKNTSSSVYLRSRVGRLINNLFIKILILKLDFLLNFKFNSKSKAPKSILDYTVDFNSQSLLIEPFPYCFVD